jgi:nitroimidazol reductase NimA-like FMN-containing flavoprotein (pyridoxamine 5'-phosphate oxidase superfamily)
MSPARAAGRTCMAADSITTDLDARYSDENATAASWEDARRRLAEARLYWLTTVRPDRRPHMTPLIGIWHDDALHFCTGVDERKARNLEGNPQCILSTGCNTYDEGLDLVVEGKAVRVEDHATLQRLADAWEEKYGQEWHFEVRDGAFDAGHGPALVFRVAPLTAFGFAKGRFGQTRWRFAR